MATTTRRRIPGIVTIMSVSATSAGTYAPVLAFEDISVDVEVDDANSTAANSAYMQWVITQLQASGQISGFMGSEFPQTFNAGDEFYVKYTEGGNDISAALKSAQAIPGKCRLKKISDKGNKDPARSTFSLKWGYID